MSAAPPGIGPLTQEALAEIVRRLVAALAPRTIYLFGSHLDGTTHGDSDVDLLVAVDDTELAREDQDERGYRALRGMFLPIELHIVGYEQFERRAAASVSFEHEVRTKGRLLYGA